MMKAMNRGGFLGLAVAAMVLLGSEGVSQTPSVVGVVRDSAGAPVASAEIMVAGRRTLSDSLGRFFLSHARAETVLVSVRRMGYESVSFTLSAGDAAKNSLDVVMRPLPRALPAVNVAQRELRARTALKGFDDRRTLGLGAYVTRADIEKRNTRLLSDILRQQRGVVITTRSGVRALRFSAHQAKNCLPMIWLDGQQTPGLDIDAVSATDVEGVELYQSLSSTPAEFHRGNQSSECGTIVIWTKRPMLEVRP